MKKKERNKIQITDSATIGDLVKMNKTFRKNANRMIKDNIKRKYIIYPKDMKLIKVALMSKAFNLRSKIDVDEVDTHPAIKYEKLLIKIDKLIQAAEL